MNNYRGVHPTCKIEGGLLLGVPKIKTCSKTCFRPGGFSKMLYKLIGTSNTAIGLLLQNHIYHHVELNTLSCV